MHYAWYSQPGPHGKGPNGLLNKRSNRPENHCYVRHHEAQSDAAFHTLSISDAPFDDSLCSPCGSACGCSPRFARNGEYMHQNSLTVREF